jgi:hypothetical protein
MDSNPAYLAGASIYESSGAPPHPFTKRAQHQNLCMSKRERTILNIGVPAEQRARKVAGELIAPFHARQSATMRTPLDLAELCLARATELERQAANKREGKLKDTLLQLAAHYRNVAKQAADRKRRTTA